MESYAVVKAVAFCVIYAAEPVDHHQHEPCTCSPLSLGITDFFRFVSC
jgi:hypothetical protein